MLKNDRWIKEQAAQGMLTPFEPKLVRTIDVQITHLHGGVWREARALSYGYDLRFNPANLEPTPLLHDEDGSYFILPAHSYGLGVALERLPSDSALRRMQRLNRQVTSLPHWAVPQPPQGGEVADA